MDIVVAVVVVVVVRNNKPLGCSLALFSVEVCTQVSLRQRDEERVFFVYHDAAFLRETFYFYNTDCWLQLDNRMDLQAGSGKPWYLLRIRPGDTHG